MYTALSEPMEAWHFDMRSPPDASASKTLDITFTRDGILNAVVFWYKLRLAEGIEISTGPQAHTTGASGPRSAPFPPCCLPRACVCGKRRHVHASGRSYLCEGSMRVHVCVLVLKFVCVCVRAQVMRAGGHVYLRLCVVCHVHNGPIL